MYKRQTDANDLYYYPNEGGKLIEIQSDNTIVDHGIIWRSGKVLDSPDPEIADRRYDGWGLHNSIPSNMIVGSGDTLNFIAGFGNPFRTAENLPSTNPIVIDADPGNFNWIQYGKPLSMKIEEADLEGIDYWTACIRMATLVDAEIGLTPRNDRVMDFLTANPTTNAWEAWTTLFMRPRSAGRGRLSVALTSASTITNLVINNTNLKVFSSTSGKIIIDKEVMNYTSATENTNVSTVTLAGVTRAADSSIAADHAINTQVYFVDKIIQDTNDYLVDIQEKRIDLENLYNTIVVNYTGGPHRNADTASVNSFGERVLSLSFPFLNNKNLDWIHILANRYLQKFKDFKNRIDITLPVDPTLELGSIVVLNVRRSFILNFETYEILQISYDLESFQSILTIREL